VVYHGPILGIIIFTYKAYLLESFLSSVSLLAPDVKWA
jgi:hypothetical protein